MFTRKQYMGNEFTHRQYYSQFVNGSVRNALVRRIGVVKIRASKGWPFNDIPLSLWAALPAFRSVGDKMREAGDYLAVADNVCIYKEAALQIIEGEE
jgi:hypothetical protein